MARHYPAWETPVNGDLYDIARRLTEIDAGYFVTRDRCRGVYALRHESDPPGRPPLLILGDKLDARALLKARYTRVSRADRLFAELEQN